jgi:hypothetical protein
MQIYESLKHTTWECKYHVVFIKENELPDPSDAGVAQSSSARGRQKKATARTRGGLKPG